MGHNAGLIYAPVNTDDVVETIGEGSHDVVTLCSSSKINKWAKWKPVRYDKPEELTEAERQSVSFGLAFGYIAQATSAAVNLLANLQSGLPAVPAWTYAAPRPGTDLGRITDFTNSTNAANPGYNHNAKPPISGFADLTIFKSEFGLASKIYNFNFKWGESSNQGANDTSGIEIPINKLSSTITDGTWRFGLLVVFPQSGKFKVALACAPSAISASVTQPGDMMIRPAATGELSSLYAAAFSAGNKELDAIPVLVKDASRTNATGSADRWTVQASSQFISMPLGEKIKIKLSDRFANVSLTFNSIVITYLDAAGTSKASYTLVPTTASSGMSKTTLAAPSASGSVRCKVVLDFTISGTMAASDYVLKTQMQVGLGGSAVGDTNPTLEQYNSAWVSISQISALSGRYRITATDAARTTMSTIMNYIESLPRRSSGSADISVYPMLTLDGARFNTSNHFIHHG